MADENSEKLELAKAYVQIVPSMDGIQSNIEKALDGVGGIGASAGNMLGSSLTDAFEKCMEFLGESVQTGMGFDSAMSQVAATMGQTVGEIAELRGYAKEMGAATAFSATQAADGLNFMALAGYDAKKSMAMLPDVLDLAAAGNMALGSASDMVTDAQSALGLSMEENTELVDKMAKTSSKSNTSVSQLGEAILQIGGTAKHLKGGTTELAATLGILADNGMKGAEGGTHLRNMLNSLISPTKDAQAMLDKLDISLYDSEGAMRSLDDVFIDLREAIDGMKTDAEKDSVITTIFNARDMKAAEALVAGVGDRFEELSGYIDDSAGAAKAMAETQLDNLAGDVTLMKSAFEGLQIEISDEITPDLRELAQTATKGLEWAAEHAGVLVGTIKGIGIAIAAVKFESLLAATSLSNVTFSIGSMTAAAINAELALKKAFAVLKNSGPLIALAAVTAAAELAASKIDKMTNALDEAYDPAEHLGEKFTAISDSAKQAADNVGEISASFHGNLDDIESEAAGYADMTARLKELNDMQKRTNTEQTEFETLIDEMNKKYPELNLKIDENTGSLNSQINALNDVANAAERSAKAEEAQAKLPELYAAKAAAQEAYNAALEKRNALIESGADMSSDSAAAINVAYISALNTLKNVNADIAEANELIAESSAVGTVEETSQAFQEHEKIVEKVKNDLKDYEIEIGNSTTHISQEAYDSIQGIADKYTELVKSQEETIGNSMNLFADFGEVPKTTFSELDGNLASNQQALEEWAAGIEKLEDAGISEGLINELKSMGTGSLEQVRALANATPAELKHYSDAYDYTYERIHEVAESQLEKTYEDSAKQIQKLINQPGKYTAKLKEAYAVLAAFAPEGYAKGFEGETAEVEKVNADMIAKGIVEAKTALDAHSPSKEYEQLGKWTGEGFAIGIEKKTGAVGIAAHNMAVRAISEVMTALDAHSPSKIFETIGTYIPQGMANGIEKDSDTAYLAAAEMASGTIDAASGYGFDFDSPSAALSRAANFGALNHTPDVSDGSADAGGTVQPLVIQLFADRGDSRPLAEWLLPDINELLGKAASMAARRNGR